MNPSLASAATPGGVTNPTLWLRADQGATASSWADQSTNANNATQGTAANQPVPTDNATENINFNPVMLFDGTNDSMVLDITKLPTGTGPRTLGSVATSKVNDPNAGRWTLAWGANATNQVQGLINVNSTLHYAGGGNDVTSAGFWQVGQPDYAMGTWAGSGGAANLYGKSGLLSGPTNKAWNTGTAGGARVGVVPWGTAQWWNGPMAENFVFNRALTATERQQLNSYISVKYGFTMSQTTPTNYIGSNGSTVLWDATANATYKNRITGIGRDDESALTQKQSKSTETGGLVTVGNGDTIATTNSANTSTFSADNSYLIFGDDNASTSPNSVVTGTASSRIGRIWKVQETGSVGSVKLSIPASTLAGSLPVLIRSTDTTFSSTDTIVPLSVNGANLEATIDLANGDYFTFASVVPAPGGVAGASRWYRADIGTSTTTNNVGVSGWADQSLQANNASQPTAANQPLFKNNATDNINFNSVVQFDGANDWMGMNISQLPLGTSARSLISVAKPTVMGAGTGSTITGHRYIMGWGPSTAGQGMALGTHENRFGVLDPYQDPTATSSAFWNVGTPTELMGIWAGNGGSSALYSKTAQVGGPVNQAWNTANSIGARIGSATFPATLPEYWGGPIGEILIYPTALSAAQRQQVSSYLAVKYGYTVSQTAATNYLASDGSTIWNATTNATYKNRVTGIGRDDASALTQKQSKSIETGGLVTVGNGNTIAATNSANASTFSADRSFLIFGDNNGALNWASAGSTNYPSRLTRVFKADTTGTVGSVKVQVPDNSSSLGVKLPAEGTTMAMLVDADGDFTSGATEVPMTLNGTNWEADTSAIGSQFFTFATATTPPDMTAATDSGSSNTDNITNDSTPTFTAPCTNGETMTLLIDDVAVTPTQVCAGGVYTITPSAAIANGTHTVASRTNNGLTSPTLTFTIDTVAPVTLATPDMTAATDSGSSNTDNITNNSTPDFTGTCTTGDAVTFLIDGVSTSQFICTGGTYTVTPSAALTEGTHAATVTATDVAGNISTPSPALNFTVDTVAPATPAITSPTNSSSTNDSTPTISGTGENGATVTVTDQSNNTICTAVVAGGAWNCTAGSALGSGTYAFKATQTDVAGNTSPQSNTVTVTLDVTAPTAPVITSPTNGSSTNDTTPTITGTGEANATLHLSIDGGAPFNIPVDAFGNWTFTSGSALAAGVHTLDATQTDAAGNVSPASPTTTFTIDTTAPNVTVEQKVGQPDPTDTNSIFFTVTFNEPINPSTFTVGDIALGTSPNSPNAHISAFTQLDATTWEFEVKGMANNTTVSATIAADVAQDLAGNNNTASTSTDNSVLYFVTTPFVNHQTTNDTTPDLTGSCTAGNSIQLDLSGPAAHTYNTTCDGSGNWSFTTTDVLPAGNYNILVTDTTATATNTAANQANALVVDLTAPTVTVNQKADQADPTNINSASFTIVFSESMTPSSFVASDLTVAGTTGTVTTLSQLTTTTWEAIVTGMTSGDTVTLSLDASKVTDIAGNNNTASTSTDNQVTYDTTAPAAPVITSPTNGTVTSDSTPTISGTGENGAVLQVKIDGSVIACAESPITVTAGVWTCTPTMVLADGPHTITAFQTDVAGNVSPDATSVGITVDTVAPGALIAPDMTAATDTGSSNTDNITNDATPDFTGSCTTGDTIRLFTGGTQIGQQVCSGGTYTITASTLAAGAHAMTVTATDAAGNVSPQSPALNITIDTTVPATPATPDMTDATDSGRSTTDNITNNTTPEFTGSCTVGDLITLTVDGLFAAQQSCSVSGTYSFIPGSALSSGTHAIRVAITDPAGNASSASSPLNITIDTTAPTAPTITSPTSGSNTSNVPVISGTGENNALVMVEVDGSPITCTEDPIIISGSTWTCTPATPLADGSHTITATQSDLAGNASPQSTASTVEVDTTPPTTLSAPDLAASSDTGSSNTDNITNDATPDFTGSCTTGDTIRLFTGGTQIGQQVCSGGTYAITASGMPDGLHAVTATATDPVGNQSATSPILHAVIDTAVNPPIITGPTNNQTLSDSTPTISGTGEPGNTVVVRDESGTLLCTTTVDSSANWSCDSAVSLSSSPHTITATQTDGANNSASSSVSVNPVQTVADPTPTPTPTPTVTVVSTPRVTAPDNDGDGVPDSRDRCPNTPAGIVVDAEGCPDGDGDGVADDRDQCPNTPAGIAVDARGCPSDGDNDGVADYKDQCPNTPANTDVDQTGCPLKPSYRVSLALDEKKVRSIKDLIGRVDFRDFGKNTTRVTMHFSIVDKNGKVVWQATASDSADVRYMETFIKRFASLDELPDGKYTLKVNVSRDHVNDQTLSADFSIDRPFQACTANIWALVNLLLVLILGAAHRKRKRAIQG